ncbi:MAG: glutaminyl-peptide cyclotransferase, partial [Chitinispirillaceae bacterium]|nr:glutaminyl-peptide cyclotransferase [Chitinispirillaceae bacterium]
VLNGIAYDAATRTFYLTGKKWKNIYRVTIESDQ